MDLVPQPPRLPRECGDPGPKRLSEGVNNITSIGIDLFEELFVYWIPAFARKTMGLSALHTTQPILGN
jgi:hypothetical protein